MTTPWYLPKEVYAHSHEKTRTKLFTLTLLKGAKNCKQSNCPSREEWANYGLLVHGILYSKSKWKNYTGNILGAFYKHTVLKNK